MFKAGSGNFDGGDLPKWANAHGWREVEPRLDLCLLTEGNRFEQERALRAFAGPLPTAGVEATATVWTNYERSGGADSYGGHFQPYTTLSASLPEGQAWVNGFSCGHARHGDGWYVKSGYWGSRFLVPHFDTPELEPLRRWDEWTAHRSRPNGQAVMRLDGDLLRLGLWGQPKKERDADEQVRMFDLAAAHARRAIVAGQASFALPAEPVGTPPTVVDGFDLEAAVAANPFGHPPSLSEARWYQQIALAHRADGRPLPPKRAGVLASGVTVRGFCLPYAASRGLVRENGGEVLRFLGAVGVEPTVTSMFGPLPGAPDVSGRVVFGTDPRPEEDVDSPYDGRDWIVVALTPGQQAALGGVLPRGSREVGAISERVVLGCLVVERRLPEPARTPQALDELAAYAGGLVRWASS